MTQKLDYKKTERALYLPPESPVEITVPPMRFIMVDGSGNPNDPEGEYQKALELLYALTYTIKMGKDKPFGYVDYTVPPLEGLWWLNDGTDIDFSAKERYCWTSMIRQPEFVTDEVFAAACAQVAVKKPHLDCAKARLAEFSEGLCVQMLHIGTYEDEPASLAVMERYLCERGLASDVGGTLPDGSKRRHHEIYLGDPRKVAPERRKTVLRLPVRRA